MANIGSFKKSGNEYQGEIVTLSVQTKGVRIVPETNRSNDNAPSHRVYVGRAEIGAAWSKRSSEGRDYLSLKLDDPSFNARSSPTCSTTKTKATPSSGRAVASRTVTKPHFANAPPGHSGRGFRISHASISVAALIKIIVAWPSSAPGRENPTLLQSSPPTALGCTRDRRARNAGPHSQETQRRVR